MLVWLPEKVIGFDMLQGKVDGPGIQENGADNRSFRFYM